MTSHFNRRDGQTYSTCGSGDIISTHTLEFVNQKGKISIHIWRRRRMAREKKILEPIYQRMMENHGFNMHVFASLCVSNTSLRSQTNLN